MGFPNTRWTSLVFVSLAIMEIFLLRTVPALSEPVSTESQPTRFRTWLRSPLTLDNQFPLALFHETSEPLAASLLGKGQTRGDLKLVISNTYASNGKHFKNDTEAASVEMGVDYGLLESFEVGAGIAVINEDGGTFDHLIDQWHRFFGMPRGGRNKSPEDEIRLSAIRDDGRIIRIDDGEFGLSNLRLKSKVALMTQDADSSLNFSLAGYITAPTATSRRFGTPAPDLGLQLLAGHDGESYSLHSGVGATLFTDTETKGYEFSAVQFSGFIGGGYQLLPQSLPDLAIVATVTAYSDLIENIPTFPDHSLYLDAGLRYLLS